MSMVVVIVFVSGFGGQSFAQNTLAMVPSGSYELVPER
jgi:hypothetical protein